MFRHWQIVFAASLLFLRWIQASDSNQASEADAIADHEFWESATLWDMFGRLQCEDVHLNHDNPNAFPIHGKEVWNLLRKAYRETMGSESSIPPAEEDDAEPTDGTKGNTGFLVGTEVIGTKELGRGNYVTEDVAQGSMIWKSKYTAKFTTADQYRKFLKAIPAPLACEIIIWAYTRFSPTGDIVACVDLEPGCFTNHASTPDKLNMVLGTPENTFENTGCDLEFYAPRDILKGEQLLMDYGFSERNSGWVAMGLARKPVNYRYEVENEDEEEDEEEEEEESDDEGEGEEGEDDEEEGLSEL